MSKSIENTKIYAMFNASNSEIKGNRAKMFAQDVVDAHEDIIRERKSKIKELKRQLMNLQDFHPSSSFSLNVVGDEDLKAKEWLQKQAELHWKLKLEEDMLKIEEFVGKEYLQEDKTEG